MSAVSDLVNGWPGGIIQASRHGLFVTPIYLVNQLYATHAGSARLSVHVDGPTFSSSREGTEIPVLDAVASRSADGRHVFIKAVNTDLERSLDATIRVRGARVAPTVLVERVGAASLDQVNGFATPAAVKITSTTLAGAQRFSVPLPRHSVSVITLTIAR